MGTFIKKDYDQQYKRDYYDNITFYAPKGTKAQLAEVAAKEGISLSELLRRLSKLAIEKGI